MKWVPTSLIVIIHDRKMAMMMTEVEILNRFLFRKLFSIKFYKKRRHLLEIGAVVPEKLGASSPNLL